MSLLRAHISCCWQVSPSLGPANPSGRSCTRSVSGVVPSTFLTDLACCGSPNLDATIVSWALLHSGGVNLRTGVTSSGLTHDTYRFLHGISDEGVPRSALYPKRTLTAPADKHTTEVTSPRRREQERREGARSPPGAGGGEGRRRSGNTAGSPHQSPNDARRAGRSSANAPPQSEPSEDPGLNVFRSQRRACKRNPCCVCSA